MNKETKRTQQNFSEFTLVQTLENRTRRCDGSDRFAEILRRSVHPSYRKNSVRRNVQSGSSILQHLPSDPVLREGQKKSKLPADDPELLVSSLLNR